MTSTPNPMGGHCAQNDSWGPLGHFARQNSRYQVSCHNNYNCSVPPSAALSTCGEIVMIVKSQLRIRRDFFSNISTALNQTASSLPPPPTLPPHPLPPPKKTRPRPLPQLFLHVCESMSESCIKRPKVRMRGCSLCRHLRKRIKLMAKKGFPDPRSVFSLSRQMSLLLSFVCLFLVFVDFRFSRTFA